MLLSIFTPTHDPVFLPRLWDSLTSQSYVNFEWVVVPNGGTTPADVASLGIDDHRLKIIPYDGTTQNIGEIKRFAASQCSGEVLVEVDHDDELTPDCLFELAKTFSDIFVDFAYSNCCEVFDGKPYKYNDVFGWRYRPFHWKGLDLCETVSFDPEPASFSKVWFAPNHVRAWRRSFYEQIGGHDITMDVCDDHDLLCRTYIEGNVKHLDKCLYVYNYTGRNTCKGDKNARIQEVTLDVHDRYIYPLVEKWCDREGLRKIDLCGGFDCPPGYESVDKFGGDITADLEERYPFEDGTVGVFRAHDALEHMNDQIHTMKEIYRCLAYKGWLLSLIPSSEARGGVQDPTHKSFWNSNNFFYFCKQQQARYIGTPVRFQGNRIKNFYPNNWCEFHKILYVKADLYKFDPNGRTCGLIEI